MKRLIVVAVAALTALATPLEAQLGGRLSAEPYVAYGFFGGLPATNATLEADVALGARVGYRMADQWALFGNFQRATPGVTGGTGGLRIDRGSTTVDHWSAGVEFSYVPRGGAEGMLPILLEAGLGQARYAGGSSDLAANLGIGSALQLSRMLSVRYGANDYISNYRGGDGVVHQIFVRVGAELTF
jgi:hypothetical protein